MSRPIKIQDDVLLVDKIVNARRERNILRIKYDTGYETELYAYVYTDIKSCDQALNDIYTLLNLISKREQG